jgi:hypothetical protein
MKSRLTPFPHDICLQPTSYCTQVPLQCTNCTYCCQLSAQVHICKVNFIVLLKGRGHEIRMNQKWVWFDSLGGDCLPAIQYLLNSPFNIYWNNKFWLLYTRPFWNFRLILKTAKCNYPHPGGWYISRILHRTLLKSGRQLQYLPLFIEFLKIWERFQSIGRLGSKFKREIVHALLVLKRVLQFRKHLVLSSSELIRLNIT